MVEKVMEYPVRLFLRKESPGKALATLRTSVTAYNADDACVKLLAKLAKTHAGWIVENGGILHPNNREVVLRRLPSPIPAA